MNQPYNEIKASSIAGVVLDCDLSTGAKIGGGTATDNTAALNAVLATASATNPIKLILDGPTAVSGLVIAAAGYTTIEGIGWQSGIWIISGSNADPINNGKILSFDPATTPPAQGQFVSLKNFMINGNRGNGTTGNSTSGQPQGVSGTYWYCNINLANLNGVRIENMYLYDSAAYEIRLNNCSDFVVANCNIYNPNTTPTANQDGIHIDGPASDGFIRGNRINNNNSDDAIALNASEGYSGLIDRITISDNTFDNVPNALRVYGGTTGSATGTVGTVIFRGNIGACTNQVITIGNGLGTPVECCGRELIFSQNSFTTGNSPYFIILSGSIGNLTLTDCVWNSPIATSSQFLYSEGVTISSLTLNNCSIHRTTAGNSTGTVLLSSVAASSISRMTINGFQVTDEQGQTYAAIPKLLAMANLTIAALYIAALDYTNIAELADSYSGITSLQGPGVVPTNAVATETAAYTVLPTDGLLRGDCTSAAFTITLPAAPYLGETHTFKKIDASANALTISGNGKDIDGAATNVLSTQYAHARLTYNGATWDVA
jgi:hypothetical protein